jgi:hypothetical protein
MSSTDSLLIESLGRDFFILHSVRGPKMKADLLSRHQFLTVIIAVAVVSLVLYDTSAVTILYVSPFLLSGNKSVIPGAHGRPGRQGSDLYLCGRTLGPSGASPISWMRIYCSELQERACAIRSRAEMVCRTKHLYVPSSSSP